ncbi:MAG: glycosyltransferase [Propionibacteriaceae bacterium]|nr:glycosyltransferase [Propionibacteriaceae bacterium]
MRVVVAAVGSRGDVVPLSHLAARLFARGHQVTLVTHRTHAAHTPAGVDLVPVASDPTELMAGPAASAVRRGSVRALNNSRAVFADFLQAAAEPTRRALPGADVLIASTFAVASVDEALGEGVPVVRAHLWPEYDDTAGPMPLLPYSWRLPAPARRVARAGLRRVEQYLGGLDGWWARGRLHLVAKHPVGLTTATLGSLHAYSPVLVPGAPPSGVVTGWWTGPDPTPLSPEVDAALTCGGDWVHIGFGSMHQGDPEPLLEKLGDACERVGVNAIVQLGAARGTPHPRLVCVGPQPHGQLFPRVRAVVHHGGAGTTGSAVRAGVPSVVVPHFADQFYWGHRLRALGVAARPVPRPLASGRVLGRLLEDALTPRRAERARQLADQVRHEDGTGRAADQVERWLGTPG